MNYDYLKEVRERIELLRREKNAVILVHNYQLGEVQEVGDFVGDSLELSLKAATNLSADTILFCGVKFMAETAKILSPEKKVLLPVFEAGCPMADMADLDSLRQLKQQHPDAVTVCYVNSTAAVKTECDLCVTSANAAKIISSIPADKEIIFLPDKNLGANISKETGRKMILWDGYCPVHMRITPEMVERKRAEFPDALLIVHPECRPEIVAMADRQLSTGGMVKFVRETTAETIIVGTELGMIYRLQKEAPEKRFIALSEQAVCMDMKMITLQDVLRALEEEQTEIQLEQETIDRAALPIRRMLDLS